MARRKKILTPIDLSNPMLVRDAIVDDLLQRFPLGPNKSLTRDDYYTPWDGHPSLHEDESRLEPGDHKDTCGYPDLVLYRLGLVGWDIRNYVRQRWPFLAAGGVTRRYNRLEKRIGAANKRVIRAGLPGLWKISYGWEDYKEVVVYATNRAHAEQQVSMFFAPAFTDDQRGVQFVSEGSPYDVNRFNRKSKGSVKEQIRKLQTLIAKQQAELERMEYLESTHEIYGVSVIGDAAELETS